MMKRTLMRYLLIPVVFAAAASLSSCGGAPPQETESPAVTTAVHVPLPSLSPTPSPAPSPSERISRVPAEWDDHGIFSNYYEKAYELLDAMTTEEKIGQMLLGHYPRGGDAAALIQEYQPGGFLLFEEDFRGKTSGEVVDMIKTCQMVSGIPLVMAVDEEGGSVVRVSRNPSLYGQVFPSPQRLFNSGGFEAIRSNTLEKAALLKKLGLNLNLAPVADVSVNPGDYMYPRTFGHPAAETAEYVAVVVSAMGESGVSSALKHFPGYGNNADTHTGAVTDNRPYQFFVESDFLPFKAGIAAGVETVLVSHNIVACMEAGVPASLSPRVHLILREELGFTGIVITDDLGMGAVKLFGGITDLYVQAVLAGNDMLMTAELENAHTAISEAARSRVIPADTIDRAVFRILSWKLFSGIMTGA